MQRALLSLMCGALWVGCDARLLHGLDERQANEVQAALGERGLEVQKILEPGKRPTWSLDINRDDAPEATRVLSELGLPRAKVGGFEEVFGNGSLVPTPTEEQARLVEAISGELERTLESVDGVVAARVHLVLKVQSRPGQPPGEAKASAFLKTRRGALDRMGRQEEGLKGLIAGAVEGLSPRAVSLVMSEVDAPVAAPRRPMGSAQRLRVLAMVLGLLVSVLACALVVSLWRGRSRKPALAVTEPESAVAPLIPLKKVA